MQHAPAVPTASAERAILVLEAIAADQGDPGVSALARATGLPKSTMHRILTSLVEAGLVDRVGTGYRSSRRILDMASDWRTLRIRNAAGPWLTELFVATRGQTIHLAVLVANEVHYLDKASSPRPGGVPTRIGGRMPATCSALGKAMLAFTPTWDSGSRGLARRTRSSILSADALRSELRQTRRSGFAVDRGEAFTGLTCVAAPIFDAGSVVAAISIAGPSSVIDQAAHGQLVRRTARRVSAALASAAPDAS